MSKMRIGNNLVERLFRADGGAPLFGDKHSKRNRRALKTRMRQFYTNVKRNMLLGFLTASAVVAALGITYNLPRRDEIPTIPKAEIIITPGTAPSDPYSSLPSLPSTLQPRLFLDEMYAPEQLTLENVKERMFDTRLGQAYLNKILMSDRVPFRSTEVVYDPNGTKAIEFLARRLQFAKNPKERELIVQAIQTVNDYRDDLFRYRKQESPPFNIDIAAIFGKPLYPENKVFLLQIPYPAVTDDDVLWLLYGAWCRTEIHITARNLTVPRNYDRGSLSRAVNIPDIKDVICSESQLMQVQNRNFNASEGLLTGIAKVYRTRYNMLETTYIGNDSESMVIKQILGTLKNPNDYNTN